LPSESERSGLSRNRAINGERCVLPGKRERARFGDYNAASFKPYVLTRERERPIVSDDFKRTAPRIRNVNPVTNIRPPRDRRVVAGSESPCRRVVVPVARRVDASIVDALALQESVQADGRNRKNLIRFLPSFSR
jgi:hypothetical protein